MFDTAIVALILRSALSAVALLGWAASGQAQNAAGYYSTYGSFSVSGTGPVADGTTVPAGCAFTSVFSQTTTNINTLKSDSVSQGADCLSAINSAIQSFENSCQGQITYTPTNGSWQPVYTETPPNYYLSKTTGGSATCAESNGDLQSGSGNVAYTAVTWTCQNVSQPYPVLYVSSNYVGQCSSVQSQPPTATIVSASDIQDGVLSVQLVGYEIGTGNLTISITGATQTATQVFPNLGPGTQSLTLNLATITPDTYSSITATWNPAGMSIVSPTVTLPPWVFFGTVFYTQYNTPTESQCSGSTANAWIVTPACTFTQISLNAAFINQAWVNGTGNSVSYGVLKSAAATKYGNKKGGACYGTYPTGAIGSGSNGNTFLQVSEIRGSCNTVLVNNQSAAGPAVNTPAPQHAVPLSGVYTLSCGNTLNLDQSNATVYNRTDADLCPACGSNPSINGSNGHVDSYSSNQGCTASSVGNLGKFFSSKTN